MDILVSIVPIVSVVPVAHEVCVVPGCIKLLPIDIEFQVFF
jgi:hypothetical protein